jgi:hypothetical protein
MANHGSGTVAALKDAKSPVLRVNVTKELRDEAVKSNSSHCMIAEAIKEAYPLLNHVSVDLQTIRFSDPAKGLRYIYLTPRACQEALVLFDEGVASKPFRFILRGAHIVAMSRSNREQGVSARERVRLGRRRISDAGDPHAVPDTVGGRGVRKHPSGASRRKFGLRAFTREGLQDLGMASGTAEPEAGDPGTDQ